MSNKATKRLVPELRFPEFREGSAWRLHALGSVGKTVSGLSGKSAEDFGKGSPFVTYKQVFDNSFVAFDKCGLVRIENGERQNDVVYGDVLITGSSETPDEVGFASVVLEKPFEKTYLNSFCFAFRSDTLLLCVPRFSQFLFHSPWYRAKVGHLAQGSTRFNISKLGFLKLKLPIPTQYEQQKIADCLSSLDDLITAQAQKIEALKVHKKGLMQQLFPAEGETVPTLRFPEFENAQGWVKTTLGQVATFKKGKGISKAEISSDGVQPCIRYGELYTHYHEIIDTVISYTNVLSDELVLSQENDVIIPASGETEIDIATASCVLKSGIALGGDLNIIRSKINGVFLSYYLNNAKKESIARLAQGISVVHLYSNQLKTLAVNIPENSEQKKIADCLASLDELITTQAQKLATLKTFKQGLMQQLFPTIDESTA